MSTALGSDAIGNAKNTGWAGELVAFGGSDSVARPGLVRWAAPLRRTLDSSHACSAWFHVLIAFSGGSPGFAMSRPSKAMIGHLIGFSMTLGVFQSAWDEL